MEKLNLKGCEEVEIQFIDGDDYMADLAKAAGINQANICLWFEELEDLDETQVRQLYFLLDCGYALERYEGVDLYNDTAADYAQEITEETTTIPEHIRYYIDYEALARDLKLLFPP